MGKLSSEELRYREALARFKAYCDKYPSQSEYKKNLEDAYNAFIRGWNSAATTQSKQALIDKILEREFLLKIHAPISFNWKTSNWEVKVQGQALSGSYNFFGDIAAIEKDLFSSRIKSEPFLVGLPRFYYEKEKAKIVIILLISLALTAMMLLGPPGFMAGFMIALPVLAKLGIGQLMWATTVQAFSALPAAIFGVTNAATIAGTVVLSLMTALACQFIHGQYKQLKYSAEPTLIELNPSGPGN